MSAEVFSREELQRRLTELQRAVGEEGFDGALVVHRVDLIYYTGAAFHGALLVPATGDPRLFAWRGQGLIGESCPLEPIPVRGFGKLPGALQEAGAGSWKRVGFEEDVLPVSWWKLFTERVWPEAAYGDISPRIRAQRSVKSTEELVQVRRSGKVIAAGFEALRDIISVDMAEYEVQARMDLVMRRAGDQAAGRTRAFNAEARGVVACGPSAAVDTAFDGPIGQPGRNPLAPMGAGDRLIARGQPVMADHTAGFNGYMTDMTRTYYIGELEARFVDAHNFCIEIHKGALKRLVPGAVPAEIYLWAVEQAEKAGYGDVFMNRGANKVRFLGHGVGMELDEWPVLAKPFTDPLEEGMVLAVEPKIIFDDGGVGVEDTVIVRPGGAEVVTPMQYELVQVG